MPIALRAERIPTPKGLEGLATASLTAAAAAIPPPAISALLEKAKPLEGAPPEVIPTSVWRLLSTTITS